MFPSVISARTCGGQFVSGGLAGNELPDRQPSWRADILLQPPPGGLAVLESIRKAQNLSVSEGFLGRKPGFPDRLLLGLRHNRPWACGLPGGVTPPTRPPTLAL